MLTTKCPDISERINYETQFVLFVLFFCLHSNRIRGSSHATVSQPVPEAEAMVLMPTCLGDLAICSCSSEHLLSRYIGVLVYEMSFKIRVRSCHVCTDPVSNV
jgi:hypothetical protein